MSNLTKKMYPLFSMIRNYAKEVWLLSIGRSFALVGGLVSFLVIGNLLSPEMAGAYYYIITWATILSFTTLPGISHGIVKLIAEKTDVNAVKKTSVNIRVQYGLIGTLCMIIVGGIFFLLSNPLLGTLFIVGGIFLPFSDTITECIFATFRGTHDYKNQNRAIAIYQILLSIFIFLILFLLKNNQGLAVGILITLPSLLGILYYFIYVRSNENILLDETILQKLKRYARSLSLYQTILGIGAGLDRLVLWVVASPIVLASYAIASLPVSKLDQLLPFEYLTVIKLANKSINKENYRKIVLIFLVCFVSLSIFTLFLSSISQPLLKLFFPKYNLYYLFNIVIWAIPFIPLGIFRGVLMSQTDHKYLKMLSITSVLIRVLLLITLGFFFKEVGVAIGIVLSTGCEALLGIFFTRSIAYKENGIYQNSIYAQ